MACPALAWPGLAWKGPLASESAGSLLSFLSIFLPFSLSLLLNFVYLFSQEPHSQQICLKPGKRILLWSKSHPRAKPVGPKRQSNCCCSPCCCCSGCCYTQIARGNWQPLKESMQVPAVAGWGCLLVVLARIEARWMLSWEFAAQFDVTSNLQLAACNGQLGAAPKLTLPPSKSARSWEYLHWAALRKTVAIKLTCLINELNFICSEPPKSCAPSVRFPCFSCVWPGTRQAPNWQSIPRHEFLFMRNLMMMRWMYPFICRYRCMVSVSISVRSCVPQSVAISVVRMQTMPQLQSPCSSCNNNNNNKGICNWNEKPALALVAASTAHMQLHSCNLQFYVGATLRQEPTISLTAPHISSLPLSLSVWCNKWKC